MEKGGCLYMTSVNYVIKVCPFMVKQCSACEFTGKYLDCPLTLEERIRVEIREGNYRGETPYSLFRAVKHSE